MSLTSGVWIFPSDATMNAWINAVQGRAGDEAFLLVELAAHGAHRSAGEIQFGRTLQLVSPEDLGHISDFLP